MRKFKIQQRETGTVMESLLTETQAYDMLLNYEQLDEANDIYEVDFYEVVEMTKSEIILHGLKKYFLHAEYIGIDKDNIHELLIHSYNFGNSDMRMINDIAPLFGFSLFVLQDTNKLKITLWFKD